VIRDHFAELVTGLEARLADAGPGEPVARKTFALEAAQLGLRLFSGEAPVAWCGVLAPFDLLHAVGFEPCFVEFVGATLAGNGAAPPLLQLAEAEGADPTSCSFHRTALGAVASGLIPTPEVVIATSAPCTGGLAVVEELARRLRRPLFVLNVPHSRHQAAVEYLAEQLHDLVGFLAEVTGRSLHPGRLREVVELTNRARHAMVEIDRLTRHVPSPARPRDLVNFALVVSLLLGREAGVRVTGAYRDELERRARDRSPGLQGERLRVLWLQNRIQFRSPVEPLLEELGVAVAVDELNPVTWPPIDPEDPFPGFARRMLSTPLVGGLAHRLDHVVRLARGYRVDGAVNPCHWGCRQGSGARGLVDRALREAGFPVLNLEVDCVDQRTFAEGQVRTRIEAFVEMLAERRPARELEA